MNASTQLLSLQGELGVIEALLDSPPDIPVGQFRGTAVIAHPHPLFGGTMQNKVVQTLARAFVQCGWRAVRFNFRGVGASDGAYDDGRGELLDMVSVIEQTALPGQALALAGFSFGAYVTSHALARTWGTRAIDKVVLVGVAASRFQVAALPHDAHDATLVLHGEQDDTVELLSVMDWARPQSLPVMVIPGVEHFFHGQLPLLKSLVMRHLRA